ncbi:unnamed protein product, partial [Choristocarpus tenellus]
MIRPRKFRFKPTRKVTAWPLRLMPHATSATEGILSCRCVVTAVAMKGSWLKIQLSGGKEGWVQRKLVDGTVILSECNQYRRYEEWGGYNRFFCGGRVMLGSDANWFMGSNLILTIPFAVF